jgi:hypothetical protein
MTSAHEPSAAQALPEWKDYIERLMPVGEAVLKTVPHPDDPQARQETWLTLFSALANGYLGHVYADPDYPEFVSMFNTAFNLYAPNPDYMYTWTPITGTGVYRLRGFRNTARFVEFSILDGYYALGTNKGTFALIDLDALKLAADTSFDLILSKERPKGYAGDWVELEPRASNILLRSVCYDWVRERDAIMSIERMDVPAVRPRFSAAETSARLAALPSWVQTGLIRAYERFTDLESRNLRNRIDIHDYVPMGGTLQQVYLEGLFDLAEDEALILETEVPNSARYWGFLLTDDQFGTIDWMNRQSSLNAFQAVLDKDGKFRGVISLHDPGVPNWLDTGGYLYGGIQGRWNKADSCPMPTTKKVKLADLRAHLPPDTPVVSAAARDASLRDRRMGAQFRRRW